MQAVLAAPMGIIRLMDMLGEREVIRNEALILLSGLVRGNATMQQIAAFEGAFERLLGIVRWAAGALHVACVDLGIFGTLLAAQLEQAAEGPDSELGWLPHGDCAAAACGRATFQASAAVWVPVRDCWVMSDQQRCGWSASCLLAHAAASPAGHCRVRWHC